MTLFCPDIPSEIIIHYKKSVNLQPGVLEYYWLCLGTVTKANQRFQNLKTMIFEK